MLDSAIGKINELIALDMGSLVEKGDKNKERVTVFVLLPEVRSNVLYRESGRKKSSQSD